MSYPWWKFKVGFSDKRVKTYIATGVTVADAIHELTSWEPLDDSIHEYKAEVVSIVFVGMAEGYEDCLPSDWRERKVHIGRTKNVQKHKTEDEEETEKNLQELIGQKHV